MANIRRGSGDKELQAGTGTPYAHYEPTGVIPILPTYTVSTVPSAASYTRGMIYVSNETGGAVVAFSDGTNWRRVTDRAIVS